MPKDLVTVEKRRNWIELKGQTRDFVFGVQDGLISILGLIAAVFGAYADQPSIIVVTGVTGAIAAALSMAAGSLLSAEAERDLLIAEIQQAKREYKEEPYLAQESLMQELQTAGLDKQTAYKAVKILSKDDKVLFESFKNTVLGLPDIEDANPIINATVMFFAFILGSAFPIVPFLVTAGKVAFIGALVSTGMALFTVGYVKGKLSNQNPLLTGIKFLSVAVIAGVLSEFIGSVFVTIVS